MENALGKSCIIVFFLLFIWILETYKVVWYGDHLFICNIFITLEQNFFFVKKNVSWFQGNN